MSAVELNFENSLVICFCEGAAELDIMNMLLENDALLFSKDQLFNNKLHKRVGQKKLEDEFLNLDFSKETVYILRIIDSKNEKLKLRKHYEDRGIFRTETFRTRPEIEILIVIDKDDFKNCSDSKDKPSKFCKSQYGFKRVKKQGFMEEYFSFERLLLAIKKHKRSYKSEFTIYDLLKNKYKK